MFSLWQPEPNSEELESENMSFFLLLEPMIYSLHLFFTTDITYVSYK